jgi:hypothetical protein
MAERLTRRAPSLPWHEKFHAITQMSATDLTKKLAAVADLALDLIFGLKTYTLESK